MAINAFTVVSEFKFDVGQAVLQADKLEKKVSSLSSTVSSAISSVENLGFKFVATFAGATGGFLGIMSNALSAATEFRDMQIEIANIIASGNFKIGDQVATFNDGLKISSGILDEIVEKSRSMGLDPRGFAKQAMMFSRFLEVKGAAGANLSQGIELARFAQKGVPALGIDQTNAQQQIASAVSGQLSKATLFGTRLFAEAGDAISEATNGSVKSIKDFNNAKIDVRVTALVAGLKKLAGEGDVVAARAKSLTSLMRELKDTFIGIGSILRPLGEAIMPIVTEGLQFAIKFLQKEGAMFVKMLTSLVKKIGETPKEIYLNLMQVENLANDVSKAGGLVALGVTLFHLKLAFHALAKIPIIRKISQPILDFAKSLAVFAGSGMSKFIGGLNFIKIGKAMMFMAKAGGILLSGIISIGGAFATLLIPIMGFSRAMERIKIQAFERVTQIMPYIIQYFDILQNAIGRFLTPFQEMVNGWSDLFTEMLGGTQHVDYLFGIFKDGVMFVDALSMAFLDLWAAFKGIIAGISAVLGQITGVFQSGGLMGLTKLSMGGLGDTFMQAASSEFEKSMAKPFEISGAKTEKERVAKNVVYNDIKMENNFKEVLQPDRIAFTIKDQLEKASQNRSQARANSAAGQRARSI